MSLCRKKRTQNEIFDISRNFKTAKQEREVDISFEFAWWEKWWEERKRKLFGEKVCLGILMSGLCKWTFAFFSPLSRSHTHTHSLSHSLSLSLSNTLTLSHTLSLSHSHSHTFVASSLSFSFDKLATFSNFHFPFRN